MNGMAWLVATILLCGFCSLPVSAAPVTFLFTGIGSGTLNTTSFADATFEVLIFADTNNVDTITAGPRTPLLTGLNGTITISGIGTGTFIEPLYVFNNQITQGVGFGDLVHFDLIGLTVPGVGLDTYDLRTSFGPISTSNVLFDQFNNVALNIGSLTFTSMPAATYTATVVPEPGTLFLLGTGLAGILGSGWRQRKRARHRAGT